MKMCSNKFNEIDLPNLRYFGTKTEFISCSQSQMTVLTAPAPLNSVFAPK